ncbi:hypothetical protein IGI04_024376, partial [Brassica rapa subsp. trilocularis]
VNPIFYYNMFHVHRRIIKVRIVTVGIVKSRVQFYFILLVRYCPLWALGGWPAWIYFWFPSQKASTTHLVPFSFSKSSRCLVASSTFDTFSRKDLLTNLYRTSLSTLKGPIPTRRVFWSSCRYSSTALDTNCWDCEISCPILFYLISTILSTLGLRRLARMDLLLVSIPKGLVLLELDISLYIRHSLSNYPIESSRCLVASSTFDTLSRKGPVPTRRVFWSSCRFIVNRSDTNCWDCEIPCPILFYLISTILSTLGLRRLARMDLFLVSIPKDLVLLELDISLYIRYSLSNYPMWDLD